MTTPASRPRLIVGSRSGLTAPGGGTLASRGWSDIDDPRRAQLALEAYEAWQKASRRQDLALEEWLRARRETLEAAARFRELVAAEAEGVALERTRQALAA